MQAGAPVIASDRGSIPEVLGDAGLKVDPTSREQLAEAMRRVLSDAVLRERLRRDGKVQAARFSWSRCAEQTLAVYEKVLAR
jgi:glycosyltransferase involved in cell wall biosynthesis